jgi:hypothetical protein
MKNLHNTFTLKTTAALAVILLASNCAIQAQTDLTVSGLEFLPATTRALVHPEQFRFLLGNYGPDAAITVKAEYFFSRNQLLGDSDDVPVGQAEYTLNLPAMAGGTLELAAGADKAAIRVPGDASGVYYPAVRISSVENTDPDTTDNVAFGPALTVLPLTNTHYVIFADYNPTTSKMEFTPEGGFGYNAYYGNNWRLTSPGAAFSVTFSSPVAGECEMLAHHLTSSSASCQGDGYAPVSIYANGVPIVTDFDVAVAHNGTHGYAEDTWKINVVEGLNTIRWVAGSLCTHYWLQRIELSPVVVPLKFKAIRPDGYGGLVISLVGPTGGTCIVEASTDMKSWSEMARITNWQGATDISVGVSPSEPVKFFRAAHVQP